MPDWSYLTLGQPVLFRLRPATARNLVVRMLEFTSSLPFGGELIDFLGHMRVQGATANRLNSKGFQADGPVCLSSVFDPDLRALRAFERFGVSAQLIGPFGEPSDAAIARDDKIESISVPTFESKLALGEVRRRLEKRRVDSVKIILQCHDESDHQVVQHQLAELNGLVDAVTVSLEVAQQFDAPTIQLLVHTTPENLGAVLEFSASNDLHQCGCFVDGNQRSASQTVYGHPSLPAAETIVRRLRSESGKSAFLLASGGVFQSADAVRLIDAGADMICLDVGMVFCGPGLPKRITETVESRLPQGAGPIQHQPVMRSSWVWALAMGIAMIFGGCLATAIALTRVVLPYDESLLGMSRFDLAAINDKLLDFMKHDRITLAGTMLSVGGLYSTLSVAAMRHGSHWASITVFVSAFAGFASFFLFLGFGYFDPFHAFVTAVLFQFLLLGVFSHENPTARYCYPDLYNDRAWRRALWGQLLFILHGATVIGAGAVICTVGVTQVFVAEDMEFLCTTRDQLLAANPHLVPLVAHDRATFGGMLISSGIVILLSSLWGFRRGASWLWKMLLVCCFVPYAMTIWVHHAVGYVDLKHLLPAYVGLGALALGGWLTKSFLCDSEPAA